MQSDEANQEIIDLLKKLLVLQLFEMGVPQLEIRKKLKMNIHTINKFLKGIKKRDVSKRPQ